MTKDSSSRDALVALACTGTTFGAHAVVAVVFFGAQNIVTATDYMLMNRLSLILCILFLRTTCLLAGCPTVSLSPSDLKTLELFFRHSFEESEAGYVFEGCKPVCSESYSEPYNLMTAGTRSHKSSVIFAAGLNILQTKIESIIDPQNANFIIHTYERSGNSSSNSQQLIFLNRSLFLKTVQDNLALFRCHLGPTIEPETLLRVITNKQDGFSQVTGDHNKVLIGIIFGYGTDSSILVSRVEEIDHFQHEGDAVPYLRPNMTSNAEDLETIVPYFVEPPHAWKSKPDPPSFGFSSLDEERATLAEKISLPSDTLVKNKPRFLYGISRNGNYSPPPLHIASGLSKKN